MDTDRNLLFAVLALQADLLDRDRFIQACTLWTARKDTLLADLLVEQGWLTPQDRADVQRLLDRKLDKHGGDVHASLAEAAGVEARGALASVANADVERSLAALTAGRTNPDRLAPAVEDFSTVPPADSAGRNLLYEEIGCGGMGRVLRGRDPQLRRDLAVKVLREEYSGNADVERRFVEEAQIGGQLQHPGVVPIYELGRFADHRPFFTMKLVKGRTLAELLKERPNVCHEQARFLTIFEQVCQTMAYAHSHGVIHRDLKPANVMVGAFGEVQVMDWGLAKVLGARGDDPEATTAGTLIRTLRSGSTAEDGRTGVVGTPAYMAPEQARGEIEAVDERADVFGLGAILCVILTGKPPYTTADGADVMRQAAAGDVTDAFGRLDNCGADAELVALCQECLTPERNRRPRGAGEVAVQMAAYQAAAQERLRKAELERTAAEARALEERKRRRLALSLAVAVLALIALGTGGGLWMQHQAGERRADQARREAEQREAVDFALGKATGLRQQARWGEAAAVLEQARRSLGDAGPDELRQRLYTADAELALVIRLDRIRQRRAIIATFESSKSRTADDYATAFREAGLGEVGDDVERVAARIGASPVAEALVAGLDEWALMVVDAKTTSWALAVARRADPDPWRNRFRDPAVWQDRQVLQALTDDALREGGAKLDSLSPQLLEALGTLLYRRGADAVPLLRAAQRRYPSDFWVNLALGGVLNGPGRAGEAACYYRVAVALRPDACVAHYNLGLALRHHHDLDGAVAEYKKAIELDPTFVAAHINLGFVLHDKHDLDGAIAEYKKAIELDPTLALPHNNLGGVLHEKQDLDGAIAEFRKAIDLAPDYAGAHTNLGLVLSDKGDGDGGIAEFRKAIGFDPKYAKARGALGVALLERGRFAEARAEIQHCLELLAEHDPLRQSVSEDLKQCEHLLALDEKLPAVLAGAPPPSDVAERLAWAQFCQQYKHRHAAAARFYADAFTADPTLAADLQQQHRYNAACSAALAAAGQGEDAKTLPDKVQEMLRRQALDWLRADLTRYDRMAQDTKVAARQLVQQRVAHWQQDADLVSVRDKAALDKLPDNERQQWRQLWDDVAVLLKEVEPKK
jgi:serine/threonine-protein kinase